MQTVLMLDVCLSKFYSFFQKRGKNIRGSQVSGIRGLAAPLHRSKFNSNKKVKKYVTSVSL